jgi:hypothetical protein
VHWDGDGAIARIYGKFCKLNNYGLPFIGHMNMNILVIMNERCENKLLPMRNDNKFVSNAIIIIYQLKLFSNLPV